MVAIANTEMYQVGIFQTSLEKWEKDFTWTEKMWEDWKDHFSKAFASYEINKNSIANQGGYVSTGNAAIQQANAAPSGEFFDKFGSYLNNLASA